MPKEKFVAKLEASASGAILRVSTPEREWPVTAALRRHRGCLYLALPSGRGISLHRDGGISFPGVPSSGGTTVCWSAVRRRIEERGGDHRALKLGPVAVFVGADF